MPIITITISISTSVKPAGFGEAAVFSGAVDAGYFIKRRAVARKIV
jgi:hypothetical protein